MDFNGYPGYIPMSPIFVKDSDEEDGGVEGNGEGHEEQGTVADTMNLDWYGSCAILWWWEHLNTYVWLSRTVFKYNIY